MMAAESGAGPLSSVDAPCEGLSRRTSEHAICVLHYFKAITIIRLERFSTERYFSATPWLLGDIASIGDGKNSCETQNMLRRVFDVCR